MRSRHHVVLFAVLAIAAHAIGFAVAPHVDWDGGGDDLGSPDPDRIESIVDRLREVQAEKWRERIARIDAIEARIGVLVDEHLARIRDLTGGDAYGDELQRLADPGETDAGSAGGGSLSGTYAEAVAAEARLGGSYRLLLAAKAALAQDCEVQPIEAVSMVRTVPPRRLGVDADVLERRVRSMGDDLISFREEVQRGASEVDAMVKYAEKVLDRATGARDSSGGQAWTGIGEREFGSSRGPTLPPDKLGLEFGGEGDDYDAVPGRALDEDGSAHRPIFLDKWYVLGPFENRFRSNLHASFLPEEIVDLDTTSRGKDGREIAWEYWRRDAPRIEPARAEEDAIYYGWTECWVERGGTYFLSLGSDDFGKLWINGRLVWESETGPKSYRPDEATIEVELRSGVNEVLFRCENFGGTMGWSVIVHPAPTS